MCVYIATWLSLSACPRSTLTSVWPKLILLLRFCSALCFHFCTGWWNRSCSLSPGVSQPSYYSTTQWPLTHLILFKLPCSLRHDSLLIFLLPFWLLFPCQYSSTSPGPSVLVLLCEPPQWSHPQFNCQFYPGPSNPLISLTPAPISSDVDPPTS